MLLFPYKSDYGTFSEVDGQLEKCLHSFLLEIVKFCFLFRGNGMTRGIERGGRKEEKKKFYICKSVINFFFFF